MLHVFAKTGVLTALLWSCSENYIRLMAGCKTSILVTFYRPQRCVETWAGAEPKVLPTRNSLHKQGETPLGGSEAQQAAPVACACCDGRFCPLLRLLDPPVWSVHADVAAAHRSLPRGAAGAPGRSWFSSPGSAPCHASPMPVGPSHAQSSGLPATRHPQSSGPAVGALWKGSGGVRRPRVREALRQWESQEWEVGNLRELLGTCGVRRRR